MTTMLDTTARDAYAEFDTVELMLLVRNNHEAFIEFMLTDELRDNPSVEDFHLTTFGRFVDLSHGRDVVALPRDHAKTTYLRLAFVYIMLFSDLQFFVYMSATHGAAAASVQVIWNMLNDTDFADIFGYPEEKVTRLSEGYLEFYINAIDEHGAPHRKLIILKAQGAGQQIRGMNIYGLRPQYVGCDDIEDDTAVKTEEGYLKFLAWFDNTFMRAVSRERGRNKVAQVGNLIGVQTLLNDNLNDPDWRKMRFGVIRKDGSPLWPFRFPIEEIKKELMAARRRGQLSAWFGEMMNMPINIETALIDFDKIKWSKLRHPADGFTYRKFITIDPAISKEETADEAAIVLHTIDMAGVPQVTEVIAYKGMTPDVMAQEVWDLCEKWDCWVVGCESVALQSVLLYYFELVFITAGKLGVDFVPIKLGKMHKTGRLRAFAAALVGGEYTLAENDWMVSGQLLEFDVRSTNNKDDRIDAASMGTYMLNNHNDLIYQDRAALEAPAHSQVTQGSSTSM